jgi:GTP-binding protein EngB required for normal cell division
LSDALDRRLIALGEAADLADGRLDAEPVAQARTVVARAGERVGLGLGTTVVALAGPTGAGKSTLFNALAGRELSAAGVRRPTTAKAAAAVWGAVDDRLLDWLEVGLRHRLDDGAGDGLVVVDLPDFDSVATANRIEVERLLGLVDAVLWVVDPQKYADGALHERYLRPLARHAATMVAVLNQADRLDAAGLAACRRDLAGLLEEDGLKDVPVLAVSALAGDGLVELRREIDRRAAARSAAVQRLEADVGAAAAGLRIGCDGSPGRVGRSDREQLVGALSAAAGVPVVVRAVDRAHRRRGAIAVGWPYVRWLQRLRPDPLRRLRVGDPGGEAQRTSLPPASPVQHAQVTAAARGLAAAAAGDLEHPWPGLIRGAATAREGELTEDLDRAVAGADLRMQRTPRWWAVAALLQQGLAAVAAVGALWLLILVGLGFLRLEDAVPLPEVRGIALPTLLLVGGALAGILLALLLRAINRAGARRRARRARRALDARIAEAAEKSVVAPVAAELDAREGLCRCTAVAAGSR